MANLEHMCLDNQSHYSLDITEFLPDLCDSQSLFTDTIEINEKCRKLNPTCRTIVRDFSYKTAFLRV